MRSGHLTFGEMLLSPWLLGHLRSFCSRRTACFQRPFPTSCFITWLIPSVRLWNGDGAPTARVFVLIQSAETFARRSVSAGTISISPNAATSSTGQSEKALTWRHSAPRLGSDLRPTPLLLAVASNE